MRVSMPRALAFATAALFLAACAPQPAERAVSREAGPEGFPGQTYLRAAAEGRPVFRIDPTSSIVVVEVRRAGSLARLGHDHVVASHDVRGYVEPDAGRADLYVTLDHLAVDEPKLRKQARFDTEPTADAIAGTRRNMLDKTLEADRYSYASIGVRRAPGAGAADVSIALHGTTRTMRVPLTVAESPQEIAVNGELALRQTDFGITPLSVVGGAIQVQDEVKLRFDIRARRMHGA
ncbi:MAG TPA: YceI family protein [Casimicrobiaceae bacterium]|nr:YceI family protein [Casimicrobiaceae bacterium]